MSTPRLASAAAPFAPLLGLLLLYGPTCRDFAGSLWRSEAHLHEPLILIVCAWLFWRQRHAILGSPAAPRDGPGFLLLAGGLLAHVLGRQQQIALLEMGSAVPVVAGTLLFLRGTAALRAAAFPLLLLALAAPLPGFLVDAVTSPMKLAVSAAVEEILYRAGLPVARSGVVLTVGQYQLLLADACSGLHSILSLAVLGLLFLYLSDRPGALHKGLVAAAILPIAFAANVARVLVLALATYGFGDAAGRGVLHEVAGFSAFAVALAALFCVDAALAGVAARRPATPAA